MGLRPLLVALLAAAATATPASAQGVASAAYVALGDSYASGEGAPASAYLPGTVARDPATGGLSTTGCHRASTAWPLLVAARAGLGTPAFVACSGAVAEDLFGTDRTYAAVGEIEPPQADAVTAATRLATISIGGADAGFTEVLTACLTLPVARRGAGCGGPGSAAWRAAERGLAAVEGGMPTPSLIASPVTGLVGVLSALGGRLPQGGTLMVVGYPRLFATAPRAFARHGACRVGVTPLRTPVVVTRSDARFLNRVALRLNRAAHRSAQTAQIWLGNWYLTNTIAVRYVGVDGAFAGHRLCDPDPWITRLRLTATGAPIRTSFHPDARGHEAYAGVVTARLPARP